MRWGQRPKTESILTALEVAAQVRLQVQALSETNADVERLKKELEALKQRLAKVKDIVKDA